MKSVNHAQDPAEVVRTLRDAPAARAARHASRAATTFARFVRNIAEAGGYTIPQAERNAVAVLATLEERLPIREVCNLEAQLPSKLDALLSSEPLNGLPAMDRTLFCERIAERAGVTSAQAESIARTVFAVLHTQISEGEARHVEARLPEDLRELWREEGRTESSRARRET